MRLLSADRCGRIDTGVDEVHAGVRTANLDAALRPATYRTDLPVQCRALPTHGTRLTQRTAHQSSVSCLRRDGQYSYLPATRQSAGVRTRSSRPVRRRNEYHHDSSTCQARVAISPHLVSVREHVRPSEIRSSGQTSSELTASNHTAPTAGIIGESIVANGQVLVEEYVGVNLREAALVKDRH